MTAHEDSDQHDALCVPGRLLSFDALLGFHVALCGGTLVYGANMKEIPPTQSIDVIETEKKYLPLPDLPSRLSVLGYLSESMLHFGILQGEHIKTFPTDICAEWFKMTSSGAWIVGRDRKLKFTSYCGLEVTELATLAGRFAITANSDICAVSEAEKITIYDRMNMLGSSHIGVDPIRMAVPPSCNKIAWADAHGRVYRAEICNHRVTKIIHAHWHAGPVTDLSFSDDGEWLFSVGSEGCIVRWNSACQMSVNRACDFPLKGVMQAKQNVYAISENNGIYCTQGAHRHAKEIRGPDASLISISPDNPLVSTKSDETIDNSLLAFKLDSSRNLEVATLSHSAHKIAHSGIVSIHDHTASTRIGVHLWTVLDWVPRATGYNGFRFVRDAAFCKGLLAIVEQSRIAGANRSRILLFELKNDILKIIRVNESSTHHYNCVEFLNNSELVIGCSGGMVKKLNIILGDLIPAGESTVSNSAIIRIHKFGDKIVYQTLESLVFETMCVKLQGNNLVRVEEPETIGSSSPSHPHRKSENKAHAEMMKVLSIECSKNTYTVVLRNGTFSVNTSTKTVVKNATEESG